MRWRGCSKATRMRFAAPSRSPTPAPSRSTSFVTNIPTSRCPDGKTPQSHLEELTWQGAAWRFPDGIPDKVRDTLEKELALIEELNYAPLLPHRARHRPLRARAGASSARAAARPPTPPSATASPSPMSTRPRSIFCSSASSRRSARSRPTSTSISSMSGARR